MQNSFIRQLYVQIKMASPVLNTHTEAASEFIPVTHLNHLLVQHSKQISYCMILIITTMMRSSCYYISQSVYLRLT